MFHVRPLIVTALAAVLVAVIALVAIPGFGRCCPHDRANESAAIATLRNIHAAQHQFRATGGGRYGSFAELSAAAPILGTNRLLDPPLLSPAFKRIRPDGTVLRSGYRFRIDLSGNTWHAWAWPEERGRDQRTFFVDGAAEVVILATVNARHEGHRGPGVIRPTDETAGADGCIWRVIR